MKPDLLRQALSLLGLAIGFGVYQQVGQLGEPLASYLVGLMFAALGALAFWYAQGERWIQVLGAVLLLYGAVRALGWHGA